MAGRRLAYPPVRASQRPSGWASCAPRRRMPGGVVIGAVFPRAPAVSHGISGPSVDPLKWTVAVVATDPDWLGRVGRVAALRPHLRLRELEHGSALGDLGCRRSGYYLVRPDGHIAAHGHERDLDRLESELDNAFGPSAGANGAKIDRLDGSTAMDSPPEFSMNIV
jgi:3-(3-hydroxy-phenyl)propionate hydroxylase